MRPIWNVARRIGGRLLRRADHAAIFGEIYRRNEWGDGESVSGPGSTRARGAVISADVIALLRGLDAQVLLDAPCGDFNWVADVADSVPEYVGVDVVAALIDANVARHATARRRFLRADVSRDSLPAADVILCRDCLVHFSHRDVWTTLENFRRSGARWLLTTTFVSRASNAGIRTGAWQPLNLEAAPFRFPPPLALVDERCVHTGGIFRDKRLALWELASLPRHTG